MQVYTGDSTGLIKSILIEKNKLLARFGTQDKNNQINSLKFIDEEETLLLASSESRINIYEVQNGLFQQIKYTKDFKQQIVTTHTYNQNIVINFKNGNNILLQKNKSIYKEQSLLNFEYENIQNTVQNPYQNQQFLILARNANPTLYDLEKNQFLWKSRNAQNDFLDLSPKIFDMSACFINKGKQAYVCTAYNRIRLYEIHKGQRQPVVDHELKDKSPLNNILASQDQKSLYVSNYVGSIFVLDISKSKILKADLAISHKLNVSKTTIKHMIFHPVQDYLAAVSLDRHIRIFDCSTKHMITKLFLKQRLSQVLFSKAELNKEMISDVVIENLNFKRPLNKTNLNLQVVDHFKLKRKQKGLNLVGDVDQTPQDMSQNFIDIDEYEKFQKDKDNIFEKDEISVENNQIIDIQQEQIEEEKPKKKIKKEKNEKPNRNSKKVSDKKENKLGKKVSDKKEKKLGKKVSDKIEKKVSDKKMKKVKLH